MKALHNLLQQQLQLAYEADQWLAEVRRLPKVWRHQQLLQEKIASARTKSGHFEAKLEQIVADCAEGLLTLDEYEYIKGQYVSQRDVLREEEQRLKAEYEAFDETINALKAWQREVKGYEKDQTIKRQLLELLVERILVYEDRRIEIQLNYSDPFQAVGDYLAQIPDEVSEDETYHLSSAIS